MNFETFNPFPGLGTLPGTEPIQSLFADWGAKSQQALAKSAKVGEEMVDLTRANVEAVVSSGRIAAAGAQSLGEEALAHNRTSLEQASAAVKSFAEARSPTELMQLQGDYARTAFDRMVAGSAKLTESLVKLVGEAVEPLSSRAAVNRERLGEIIA